MIGSSLRAGGEAPTAADQGRDDELLAEPGEAPDLVDQVPLGLRQRFERHGAAAAAEERLDEGQGQERPHGRLAGRRPGEVEDDLAGEAREQPAPPREQLADAGDRPQVQDRGRVARLLRPVQERIARIDREPAAAGLGRAARARR